MKEPKKKSQGEKQTKCIGEITLRIKEQHQRRKEAKESSNHQVAARAWSKRGWKKEDKKRP